MTTVNTMVEHHSLALQIKEAFEEFKDELLEDIEKLIDDAAEAIVEDLKDDLDDVLDEWWDEKEQVVKDQVSRLTIHEARSMHNQLRNEMAVELAREIDRQIIDRIGNDFLNKERAKSSFPITFAGDREREEFNRMVEKAKYGIKKK